MSRSKQTKRKVAHDNKSQLDIITQQLHDLEETKIKLQGQATSLVVQKATQCMEKMLESTKSQRKRIEIMFVRDIQYEKCRIATLSELNQPNPPSLFSLVYDDSGEHTAITNRQFVLPIYTMLMAEDDGPQIHIDCVRAYAKLLLKIFMTEFHQELSKHVADLVPLKDIIESIESTMKII